METSYFSRKRLSTLLENSDIKDDFLSAVEPFSSSSVTEDNLAATPNFCRHCSVAFSNASLFRGHCKTESHVENLKKSIAVSANIESSERKHQLLLANLKGEPQRIWLKSSALPKLSCGILKALVTRRDAPRSEPINLTGLKNLLSSGQSFSFAVLLATAGHFAGAVFRGDRVIAHKAFHRYVIRAKQGHAQSKRDGSGRCHSGGSSLRRHNEVAFQDDIQQLLNHWANDYFGSIDCIFVHSPHRLVSLFFDRESGSLRLFADKVRSIPFSIGRPTFELCRDVASKLFMVAIVPEEVLGNQRKVSENGIDNRVSETSDSDDINLGNFWTNMDISESSDQSEPETRPNKQKALPLCDIMEVTGSSVKADRLFDEIFTCCRAQDADRLQLLLTLCDNNTSLVLNRRFGLSKENLLHMVAKTKACNAEIIDCLLLAGCDPTAKDLHGKVPFEVAHNNSIRNVFIKFRNTYPDKVKNWSLTRIPSEDMPVQETKKKPRRRTKKKVDPSQNSQTDPHVEEAAARERFLSLKDEEKRLQRSSHRCFMCAQKYESSSAFEYLYFKFCSVQCLRTHRHLRKEM